MGIIRNGKMDDYERLDWWTREKPEFKWIDYQEWLFWEEYEKGMKQMEDLIWKTN